MSPDTTEGSIWARLQTISDIITPMSVFVAFLIYIGWIRTRSYFDYFGVNLSLLGFAPQDYVFRSADVSLGGLLVLGLAATVLVIVDRLLRIVIGRITGTARRRRLQLGFAVVASAMVVSTLAWASWYAALAVTPPVAGAGYLTVAALVLLRLRSDVPTIRSPAVTSLIVALLVIASLWGATVYARDLGEGAARALIANPNGAPVVTVYSSEQLDIPLGGTIAASRTAAFDGRWTYVYSGGVLLTYANQRWFVLSRFGDEQYRPAVVIISDNDRVRVETSRTQAGR